MSWKDWSNFFETPHSPAIQGLFESAKDPWQVLEGLNPAIEAFFADKRSKGTLPAKLSSNRWPNGGLDEAYFILESQFLEEDFIDKPRCIFISKGVFVEAGATIKNHLICEAGCEIRQGAYLRGNIFMGERCVAGHTTEIKNSILLTHVEAGHFSYIGDSVVGAYVNLGAGTKISNLEFRTLAQKQAHQFTANEIQMRVQGEMVATGKVKFGAIIGEGSETGCNSVISPMSFLMRESWVLPNLTVPKGVYPKDSKLTNYESCKQQRL